MKKAKRLMGFVLAFLVVVGLGACGQKADTTASSSSTTASTTAAVKATVIIQEDGKESDKQEVALAKDTSLFDTMSENFDIKDDNGFITSIDGKEQDKAANKYWTFTINDEQVNVGAKDVTVADGDKIIFNLAGF